jgi:hypothetical protein
MSSPSAVLRRAQPRVRLAPRAPESDGDDACFLASSYGLTPDDWQEDILDDWLGRRRNGRWAAATCGLAVPRQNGKNGIIEVRELFGMIALGEKFLHTAHEVKTARKAFLRIASFFENPRQYPELAALVKEIRKTNGQEAVALTNGGAVEFIARSKGSGRGFTVDVLVCDEAQDLTDEELAALLPTISAAPLGNPQVIFTGTPPDPSKPVQGEVFRRVRADGAAGSDKRLAWADYGAADGPMPDVDDRALWPIHNPALGTRLHVGEIERERALMDPERFAAERYGWWGEDSQTASVFGREKWRACEVGTFDLTPVGAVGIAVSHDREWATIGAADKRGEVMYIGTVSRQQGTHWLADEARRIYQTYGCPIVIDERGPAADLIDNLQDANAWVVTANTSRYLDGCAELFDAVAAEKVAHMGSDIELNLAVAGAGKRTVSDRWAWSRRKSTHDVSALEAVTLAAWGVNYIGGGVIMA